MTKEEVVKNLCYKDNRNPDHYENIFGEPPTPRPEPCFCDSCFHGRDKLALEILRLLEEAQNDQKREIHA